MQPNQGPAPGARMALPPSAAQPFDTFLERWWVVVPGRLRRYSVYLSETWADGIYLTAWPMVAALAPVVLLLFGVLEGATHWSLLINDTIPSPGEVPITFTQLLPLMVLTAAVSALSANLGLVLVLGYALGDFLIAGFRLTYAQGFEFVGVSTLDPVQSFLYLHLAQLISYVLFLLLVITPTLSSRYLVPRLDWLTKGQEPASTLVRVGALMIIQGAIVYSWTLSAPLLIRIFWAWTNDQPPLSAAYYLQEQGGWVVAAAVIGVAVRQWLAHQARRNPAAIQRFERQASALRAADTRRAFSRRVPPYIRAILAAGVLTLLISGFISSLLWGAIIFLFLSFILIARTALLPSLALWKSWVSMIARIPIVVRLAAGALLSFILSQVIISFYQNQPSADIRTSESFLPVLISVGISLLIMTALVPPASQLASTPAPTRPPTPPLYSSPPPPPPPAMWPAPPAQPAPPVHPPPPTWQAPPTQPPPQIPPA